MTKPQNALFIMTDEERYPPPYELDALAVLAQLRSVLEATRERVRRTPQHVNA